MAFNYFTQTGIKFVRDSFLPFFFQHKEWGWKNGLVSSDFHDIQGLTGYHVVNTVLDAAVLSLKAGVDMDLN